MCVHVCVCVYVCVYMHVCVCVCVPVELINVKKRLEYFVLNSPGKSPWTVVFLCRDRKSNVGGNTVAGWM